MRNNERFVSPARLAGWGLVLRDGTHVPVGPRRQLAARPTVPFDPASAAKRRSLVANCRAALRRKGEKGIFPLEARVKAVKMVSHPDAGAASGYVALATGES